jgi:hypothetical protein
MYLFLVLILSLTVAGNIATTSMPIHPHQPAEEQQETINSCPVCFEPFSSDTLEVIGLTKNPLPEPFLGTCPAPTCSFKSCFHSICQTCFWRLTEPKTCPLCRTPWSMALKKNTRDIFLYIAMQSDNLQIFKKLLSEREEFCMHDENTILNRAIIHRKKNFVHALLEAGANPNHGVLYTPLQIASTNCLPGIISMLLEHGADPELSTHSHNTPLQLARAQQLSEQFKAANRCVKLLEDAIKNKRDKRSKASQALFKSRRPWR